MRIWVLAWITSIVLLAFLVGWISQATYATYSGSTFERPVSLKTLFLQQSPEIISPADRIPESSIHVYPNRVLIDQSNIKWSTYADSNSMDPLLDKGANGLEVTPDYATEIQIGDVISFRPSFTTGLIVHRVVQTGYDGAGWYAVTKGDNNPTTDPGKVRFDDVHGVLVGVLY
jgi:hypothetical protein